MQLEKSSAQSPRNEGERQGVSPVKAFLVLLALAIAAGVFLMLTRSEPVANNESTSAPTSEPDYSLTNAEAITRFKELKQLEEGAYRNADPSIIRNIYTESSPVRSKALTDLRRLRKDGVRAIFNDNTLSLKVVASSSEEIRIRHELVTSVKFVTAQGKNVTQKGRRERQRILWTLQLEDDAWLIHDARIEASRPVS